MTFSIVSKIFGASNIDFLRYVIKESWHSQDLMHNLWSKWEWNLSARRSWLMRLHAECIFQQPAKSYIAGSTLFWSFLMILIIISFSKVKSTCVNQPTRHCRHADGTIVRSRADSNPSEDFHKGALWGACRCTSRNQESSEILGGRRWVRCNSNIPPFLDAMSNALTEDTLHDMPNWLRHSPSSSLGRSWRACITCCKIDQLHLAVMLIIYMIM